MISNQLLLPHNLKKNKSAFDSFQSLFRFLFGWNILEPIESMFFIIKAIQDTKMIQILISVVSSFVWFVVWLKHIKMNSECVVVIKAIQETKMIEIWNWIISNLFGALFGWNILKWIRNMFLLIKTFQDTKMIQIWTWVISTLVWLLVWLTRIKIHSKCVFMN